MRSRITRRGFVAGALAVPFAQPISISLAQNYTPGAELPPLLMESFSDQMTVEVTRLYIRELEKLGIRVTHKPLVFSQILGKVYGSKDVTTAMMGLGFPEERFDPTSSSARFMPAMAPSISPITAIPNTTFTPISSWPPRRRKNAGKRSSRHSASTRGICRHGQSALAIRSIR